MKINISSSLFFNSFDYISLPAFDNNDRPIEHFKTGVVYQKCHPQSLQPYPDLTSMSDPFPLVPQRTSRVSHPPNRYRFSHTANQAILCTTSVPKSYSQAATQARWQQVMKEKLQALMDNHTWGIISRYDGVKLIGCKLVYNINLRLDGTI